MLRRGQPKLLWLVAICKLRRSWHGWEISHPDMRGTNFIYKILLGRVVQCYCQKQSILKNFLQGDCPQFSSSASEEVCRWDYSLLCNWGVVHANKKGYSYLQLDEIHFPSQHWKYSVGLGLWSLHMNWKPFIIAEIPSNYI